MNARPLTVNFWPDCVANTVIEHDLFVIAVRTPQTTLRDEARQKIRAALTEVLAIKLACPPQELVFISTPGQALKLLHSSYDIGLSISHESGLSVAAVNMQGNVGVDVMLNSSIPNGDEMLTLARDYFGIEQALTIEQLPEALQSAAFIHSWVKLEARLKCLEIDLVEWSGARDSQANVSTYFLNLPDGYTGVVATTAA